jgi:pimeloyl-ACP methyl ester carboxylesterase
MTNNIPIVFVPALLGTELIRESDSSSKGDELVYVTPSIGLNLNSPEISLPLQWHHSEDHSSLPVQAKDDIIPGKVMEKIKLDCCCPITLIDQYSTFCQHYRSTHHSAFYTFAYDWRRDLNESTDNLLAFLEEVRSKHGIVPQVISHSMGCLIAMAALHTKPSSFHSVIFAGGNFGGGAGFYPTNTVGMPVGLNNKFLSGSVCHTFPSMYAAASPMGIENDPILRDEDGHQLFQFIDSMSLKRGEKSVVKIDMYKLDDWKRFKLGPWSLNKDVSLEMQEHVRICLKLGKIFQAKLRGPRASNDAYQSKSLKEEIEKYPPVAVLVGDQFLNPDHFLWDTSASRWIEWSPQTLKEFKPKNFVRTDGTVSYISASQPPLPKEVNVMEYKARNNGNGLGSHRELVHDVELIDMILEDLRSTFNNHQINERKEILEKAF